MLIDYSTVTVIQDDVPVLIQTVPNIEEARQCAYMQAVFPNWNELPRDVQIALINNQPKCWKY